MALRKGRDRVRPVEDATAARRQPPVNEQRGKWQAGRAQAGEQRRVGAAGLGQRLELELGEQA